MSFNDIKTQAVAKWEALQNSDKVRILVGMATCGRAAGALDVLDAIEKELERLGIDAIITEVGCIGLCSSEPLVDVALPGFNRLSFEKVTADKVEKVLDDVFTASESKEHVLGQFRQEGMQSWDDVPYIDQLPFFAPQQRLVLKNCGIIDPTDIDEYIARDGYFATVKVLILEDWLHPKRLEGNWLVFCL